MTTRGSLYPDFDDPDFLWEQTLVTQGTNASQSVVATPSELAAGNTLPKEEHLPYHHVIFFAQH